MSTPRKVALVTGAATGVGRAVAVRFAAGGMAVAVNYSRSEDEARETLAMVQGHNVPALLCRANVAVDDAVRAMVKRCGDEPGLQCGHGDDAVEIGAPTSWGGWTSWCFNAATVMTPWRHATSGRGGRTM